jgi:hypothetical protein
MGTHPVLVPVPINAKAETVDRLPMFREAYRKRRCIVPIDGFFEWMAIKGAKVKQPYAIAMKDRSPFGLRALGELERPCHRRVGSNLLHHHHVCERARRAYSRPHAGDPQAGRLQPVARPRSRRAKPPTALPLRADGDLAYFDARELAEERRR